MEFHRPLCRQVKPCDALDIVDYVLRITKNRTDANRLLLNLAMISDCLPQIKLEIGQWKVVSTKFICLDESGYTFCNPRNIFIGRDHLCHFEGSENSRLNQSRIIFFFIFLIHNTHGLPH